ncbi:MAG: signal peptidase II [Candidatus Melainabacteria bacterium]|nr:signal peptidase II [Candidatus Melainabacteria bacterium]
MAQSAPKKLHPAKLIAPLTTLICLALDLCTKSLARTYLSGGMALPLIPGLIQLTLTSNTGGAFGIGSGLGGLMTILALVMVAFIGLWIWNRDRSKTAPGLCERLGMGLLVGGALGNLWDRLTLGQVTDFLEFTFIVFPIFNLADIFIDLGIALILTSYYCTTCQSRTMHNANVTGSNKSKRQD